jgi:tetratricopeptide (TPR) repeat protein
MLIVVLTEKVQLTELSNETDSGVQMKNIKLILILLFLFIRVPAEISFPEWVIEDAYEKELLLFNDIKAVTPEEMRIALDQYNKGRFKNAAEIFEKLRQLNLPDQRLDFIVFALGECYRGLGVHNKAQDQYRFMVKNFPGSDYIGLHFSGSDLLLTIICTKS